MKQKQSALLKFEEMPSLDEQETFDIWGGGVWTDLCDIARTTWKALWHFSKNASEFQASLPLGLKK